MKRTLFIGLSALALSLTTAPVFANEMAAANLESRRHNNIVQITPFNLVTRSYQGAFVNQGIPSNGVFISAINRGQITAEDLVNTAIASGRLAPETINDQAYLRSVSLNLRNLDND